MRAALLAVALTAGCGGCGRGTTPVGPPGSGSAGVAMSTPSPDALADGAPALLDPTVAALWARAKDGEAEDRMRLADREGSVGLVERAAAEPEWRLTAARSLAYAKDFLALPWLADLASGGTDEEALAALESAGELAAQPRTARDPEDAAELKEGCDKLLLLARGKESAKPRRVLAIDALRMLADRGCVKRDDIPRELDSK